MVVVVVVVVVLVVVLGRGGGVGGVNKRGMESNGKLLNGECRLTGGCKYALTNSEQTVFGRFWFSWNGLPLPL